jgi:hypothetical protein
MSMQNHADFEGRLLGHLQRSANPILTGWLGTERLTSALRESLRPTLTRMFDDELAAGFRSCCPVDGVPASAYKNRLLKDDVVGEWLAGIRFKNLDLASPFVDVLVTETPLDAANIGRIVAASAKEFSPFRPQRVRFHRSSHLAPQASLLLPDRVYVAAPLTRIAGRPAPPSADRIRLASGRIATRYDQYASSYAELLDQEPHLRGVVKAESAETLQECEEAGLLFEIMVDDRWAGIFAAKRRAEHGLTGYCVTELLLTTMFRHRGLGPAVAWTAARALPRDAGHPLLYGTIGSTNVSSRRTASKIGRVEVSGDYFAEIAAVV